MKNTTPIIFGDSHTRSFVNSYCQNIIFAGTGKELNFLNLKNVFKIFTLVFKLDKRVEKNTFILVFGEPDIRFLSYGKFEISEQDIPGEAKKIKKNVLKSIKRYSLLISLLKIFKIKFILSAVHSPNSDISEIVICWNEELNSICKFRDIMFFETDKYLNNGEIDPNYVGNSIHDKNKKDHVHLSTKVGKDFYDNFKTVFNFNVDLLSSIDYLHKDKNLGIFKFNTNI
tara:strand:- start:3092 stop:3775 length:684 start_codon:yes stop_codon:yes gene_type:complete